MYIINARKEVFMSELWPAGPYESALSVRETEHAIVMIKDFFQLALSIELNFRYGTRSMVE